MHNNPNGDTALPTLPSVRQTPRSPYLALFLTAIQQALAYRGRAILSVVGNGIWVVAIFYLWRNVYAHQSQVAGYDWATMRTYLIVAYAVSTLLSFSSAARLMNLIRTGDIAQELLRPIHYLGAQLALASGGAIIEGFIGALMAVGIGIMLLGIRVPPTLPLSFLFLVSVMLGFLIKFLISFLVALLCFWTTNGVGLLWAQTALINLFSGALIPLAFFPEQLRILVTGLPFQGIVHTPLQIYLGQLSGWGAVQALGVQIGWVFVLWLITRLTWQPALRALDIQGG